MLFELTNKDRKYLGLNLVKKDWVKVQLTNEIYVYFEGAFIKKSISVTENFYKENDMNEETSENRTILLPKTKRGKPKKLNFSSFQARNGIGAYFSYAAGNQGITIGNYTTQKTFYSTYFEEIILNKYSELRTWLDTFIASSSPNHLQEIKEFSNANRQRVKVKEGDFFAFKIDRYNYGFGRVLLDIRKLRKEKLFDKEKHYGLSNLMGQPLTVKIYHKISASKAIDINELKNYKCFPSGHIMDNRLFYGDYEIIGNLPLEGKELDFPISFSQSISYKDPDTFYLQWGLIYKEKNSSVIREELKEKHFRNEGIGLDFILNKRILENCIKDNSNTYYWNNDDFYSIKIDLRNPNNQKDKEKICNEFGLDPHIAYYKNLQDKNL